MYMSASYSGYPNPKHLKHPSSNPNSQPKAPESLYQCGRMWPSGSREKFHQCHRIYVSLYVSINGCMDVCNMYAKCM